MQKIYKYKIRGTVVFAGTDYAEFETDKGVLADFQEEDFSSFLEARKFFQDIVEKDRITLYFKSPRAASNILLGRYVQHPFEILWWEF